MSLDLDRIRACLPAREIRWLDKTDSTMVEAAQVAASGGPSGSVVLAEEQSAGHGRRGRRWHSERGSGLYLSLVLRLPLPADSLPALTLAVGLATSEAIADVTDIACDLRWPNDVLVGDRKCAGILLEVEANAIIAGIGINVNQQVFPDDILHLATSLRICSGHKQSRETLLISLLESVDRYCDILVRDGREPILRLFSRNSSYVQGRRVTVDQGDAQLLGITAGLDPSGFLLLQDDEGASRLILAGGVRPA